MGLVELVQVESNSFKRPGRCTGSTTVSRPYILVQRYECNHTILREHGEYLAEIFQIFGIILATGYYEK